MEIIGDKANIALLQQKEAHNIYIVFDHINYVTHKHNFSLGEREREESPSVVCNPDSCLPLAHPQPAIFMMEEEKENK